MSKKLLQDMVKVKSVSRKVQAIPKREADVSSEKSYEPSIVYNISNKKKKGGSRYMLWLVAFVSILFFLYSISLLFSNAEIVVNPKIKDVTLNENLSAVKNASGEALPFDLVMLSGEETKTVVATDSKDLFLSSKGKILLYNNFSATPQKLNINTRLEGSNGKIYKTLSAVNIPGKVGNIPGKVEVGIYGAVPGVEYDSTPLDFKVLGFKGTPKYLKFFGRGEGNISGGFKGKSPVVSDAIKISTFTELKASLMVKLLQKATAPGFILFKDAAFLNIDGEDVPFVTGGSTSVPITLKGTLYGFLLNENKLVNKIVTDNIDKYDGSDVYIQNINNLTFSLTSPQIDFSAKDNSSILNLQNINFSLSGTAKIVWKIDENKLINDLLGKSKKDFNQVLLQYPNISSAQSTFSPFWRMSFPDKSKSIKVITNYPQ